MSRLFGKLAVIAASTLVSATVAGVVVVKKTKAGAKAWRSTQDFCAKQYGAAQGVASKAAVKIEEKCTEIKEKAARSGEAKAVAAELVKDQALYETMKATLAERQVAKR